MHHTLRPFHDVYRDRTAAAHAWKASGRKVVGYLCDNVPEELILAAGFFPLRVSGAPGHDLQVVRDSVDRLYPPDVTARPAFVDSILARLLDGTYDVLDYLIVPHNRNAIQAIHRHLRDAKQDRPKLRIPELYYLDKAWSPYFSAEIYNRDCVFKLRTQLEAWSNASISAGALAAAIEVCDENRRLLGRVSQLRLADPPRLSGVDALAIYGSSMLMLKAEHNQFLHRLLADASTFPERRGLRVFLGGSPFDHSGLYELVESLGATIIAEDHCWGARVCDVPEQLSGNPLLALAERFHRRPACSILFPIQRTIDASVTRALLAKASAAIFYVMDGDTSQNWETPDEVKQLRSHGLSVLHLRGQPYECDASLRDTLADFLASLAQANVQS